MLCPGLLESNIKFSVWENNRKLNGGWGQSIRIETLMIFFKIYRPNAVAPTVGVNPIDQTSLE
jgi:hypothetical protein